MNEQRQQMATQTWAYSKNEQQQQMAPQTWGYSIGRATAAAFPSILLTYISKVLM
jgi:hypothetical protein